MCTIHLPCCLQNAIGSISQTCKVSENEQMQKRACAKTGMCILGVPYMVEGPAPGMKYKNDRNALACDRIQFASLASPLRCWVHTH